MRIRSCDKNPIVTRMMMNLDILFSLVSGRSTEAVVSGVLHIGADVVVPRTVSVCKCSFSSPMRLRVSPGRNLRPWADRGGAVRSASDRRSQIWPIRRVVGRDNWSWRC
uniref:Uncharacterized protein n=1 Tax=Ananas comosus var. bracteatus TaxID=296719 RepID=A0A6V7NT19_ANACO|nr:unnamed protein product [Ananas comosus var. bracteatus]